nr:putative phage abortive infection protein [Aliarcobacter butzleri]
MEEGIPRLNHILFLYLNESNTFPKEFRNIPIEEIKEEIKLKYKKNQLNDTKNLYIYFTNIYGEHLNHLMRTTYHIINFVDKNNDIKNKKFYINILRSQINISETILIFYNAISKHGKNLLPLVIKYEFFEHLVYNEFICRPTLKLYIEKTKQLNKNYPINKAFGENYNYKKLLKELYEETNTSSQERQ